ncbi:MAG: rRNA pseudouridine synthase [Clostridia bacterium]|nr:rRNA pseudouridine synthase [Clostridia bacterium]
MRLDKFVSRFADSRREARNIIKKGRVNVEGALIKDPGFVIDENSSTVELDGERLNYKEFIYIMMNKPSGVISATEDPRHRTVVDLLPDGFRRYKPFPVGRLDIDTEGLLLLTNDGQASYKLLSPKRKVPKRYIAVLDCDIDDSHIEKFREGIVLSDGYKTKPACLSRLEGENEVSVTITEGKFHQVKRMFADLGRTVLFLKRIEFAGLSLDPQLLEGQSRELTPQELKILDKIMQ